MKAFEIMAISLEEFTTRYCNTEKPYPIDIVMDGMSLMGPDGIGVHEPVFLLKVLQFFVPTEKHNGHAYKVIVVMRKDLMEKHIPTEDTVQYNHLIKQGQLVVVATGSPKEYTTNAMSITGMQMSYLVPARRMATISSSSPYLSAINQMYTV